MTNQQLINPDTSEVRFGIVRSQSAAPLRFFDLLAPSSVSTFGLGISVDGSVGESLGILHLSDSMRIQIVGLIIPWSQVRVLAGPPSLIIFHSLMALGQRDCPFSIVPWSEVTPMGFRGLWDWD